MATVEATTELPRAPIRINWRGPDLNYQDQCVLRRAANVKYLLAERPLKRAVSEAWKNMCAEIGKNGMPHVEGQGRRVGGNLVFDIRVNMPEGQEFSDDGQEKIRSVLLDEVEARMENPLTRSVVSEIDQANREFNSDFLAGMPIYKQVGDYSSRHVVISGVEAKSAPKVARELFLIGKESLI